MSGDESMYVAGAMAVLAGAFLLAFTVTTLLALAVLAGASWLWRAWLAWFRAPFERHVAGPLAADHVLAAYERELRDIPTYHIADSYLTPEDLR